MGLKSLMEHLQSRTADTPETLEKTIGYQRKVTNDAGCTPETPDLLRLNRTREIPQLRQFEETADPLASPVQYVLPNSGTALAANDVTTEPDRWCWPQSSAMNTTEIHAFAIRVKHFQQLRFTTLDAEKLADQLVNRDREGDERHLCLECGNLICAGAWRCKQWQPAGFGARDVPAELIQQLQRCQAFEHVPIGV